MLREGGYLNGVAEIGALEHSLTTDLLNHLVFVQKVFMKVGEGGGFASCPRVIGIYVTIMAAACPPVIGS